MARRGKIHFIGLGMAVGAVAMVVGAFVYAWTGDE